MKWFFLLISLNAFSGDFYSLKDTFHNQKFIEVSPYNVSLHQWTRPGHKNLIVTSHGYMNNCGYLKNLHEWLLQRGFDILCIELPGHGKSTGRKYDINSFKTYERIIENILTKSTESYQSTRFIGHSTGTAGMTQYLLNHNQHRLDQIILLAPLVRSYLYQLSYWGWRLGGRVIPWLPRRPLSNVTDDFRAIVKSDPSYYKYVPSHFARELFNWNARLLNSPPKPTLHKLDIIWAAFDTVIDKSYNQMFFKRFFPRANHHELACNHMFFYNSLEARQKFYEKLAKLLQENRDG